MSNAKFLLGDLKYQPQQSCSVYTKILDRVARIDAERKKKVQRVFLKDNKYQSSELSQS